MTIGKELRMEIRKRDGFRCKYCGVSADKEHLQVDHIVPKSKGGTDHPDNLLTACADCNQGKSDIELTKSRLLPDYDPVSALEYIEQIRAELALRRKMADTALGLWRELIGEPEPSLPDFVRKFAVPNHTAAELVEAIQSTAKRKRGDPPLEQKEYFGACLHHIRKERGIPKAERLRRFAKRATRSNPQNRKR